jgi:DNA-directed RNA polymerase specialized sigma54-like protein
MEQKITLTLARADAEGLVKSLRRRKQRLCDIKQEICEPEDDFELEECNRSHPLPLTLSVAAGSAFV